MTKHELILGSGSPRRKEILSFFSIPFTQISSTFDETLIPYQGNPHTFVCEVARSKAISLRATHPESPILTADTVVALDGRLFFKPESLEEAFGMLKELAGKEHTVFTGVCVAYRDQIHTMAEESKVEFLPLSDQEISTYHATINPLDKAGGYAIQQGGCVIVKRIQGCYYNIMGLPLNATRNLLAMIGINLWDFLKTL